LTQWDIYTFDFAKAGTHPAVIISHPDRVARAQAFNVLLCSSQRASREPKENEVILDREDGLDWETLVRCDMMYEVEKSQLRSQRGKVSAFRRRAIVQKIAFCYAFNSV
jgi:mRNA-degrading endonuclease toxin of MazEF toxin-antitoxin module